MKHFFILLISLAGLSSAQAAAWHAGDWIDGSYETSTGTWQRDLGVDWTRISCKVSLRNTPAKCVNFIAAHETPDITKYFIYIAGYSTSTMLTDAVLYSSYSLTVPSIEEVSLDDFFGNYDTWYNKMGPGAWKFLNQYIDNLKSVNPKLKFGITLYEDELGTTQHPYVYLDDTHLPPSVKAKFDYIHLFIHYRADGPKFAEAVAQTKIFFPNAQVIAGVYPYDRIDYLFGCSPKSKTPCTESEEISYFQQAWAIQLKLLRQGQVIGFDIYPGYFGDEAEEYSSKGIGLTCKDPARCVNNSILMRHIIQASYAEQSHS